MPDVSRVQDPDMMSETSSPRAPKRSRRGMAGALLAALVASSVLTIPAMAQSLPNIAADTPYAEARTMLLGLGYRPAPDPDASACDANGDATCYPERIACAGTGLGQCIFAWRKDAAEIEIVTIGEMPIVSIVRCRAGC
jgi:hypothetical protein